MKKKNTDDLQRELSATSCLSSFLCVNREEFISESFASMLQDMFRDSGMSKAALAKKAGTSEVYLYQIFSGERTPSRDRAICLCYARLLRTDIPAEATDVWIPTVITEAGDEPSFRRAVR